MAAREGLAFGDLLRRHRRTVGLTQEELAERAGLSERGIADLERGARRFPHQDTVRRLAEALELAPPQRAALVAAGGRSGQEQDRSRELHGPGLPAPLTSFIGRNAQITDVRRLLESQRLLTLTGPGGIGKSRLALQVATEVSDEARERVALIELAALANPELVPQTVATSLGIAQQPGQPLLDVLADALRARQHLLVLDNCEHVILMCAELTEHLLQGCPTLRVLATSREPLGIAGESAWRVPSLSLPVAEEGMTLERVAHSEAVELFVDRAASAEPGFVLTERNAPDVARLCLRLDGIPLALELAAARLTVLSVDQLAERLDDALRLLTVGSRTAPARQQTLRATLDWSYDLLSADEQTVLKRLTVFAGGCTLGAAETVCADTPIPRPDVLDLLGRLIAKSLVQVDNRGDEARYQLLETIRQYAREKLLSSAEADAVRDRHCDYYLALAERAEPHLTSADQAAWLDVLELERDNLRAALTRCWNLGNTDMGLRLAAALNWYWYVREDRAVERRDWLERFLRPTAGPASPGPRGKALAAFVLCAAQSHDFPQAEQAWEEFRTICAQTGDGARLVRNHWMIGRAALWQGDNPRAQTLFAEGIALTRDAGDRWALGQELEGLGWVALDQGDNAEARRLCKESLVHFRACQDWRAIAYCLQLLGRGACRQGDYPAAHHYLDESLAIHQRLQSKGFIARVLYELGVVVRNEGDFEASRALLEQSLDLARKVAPGWLGRNVQVALGWVAHVTGDPVLARTLVRGAMSGFPRGNPRDSVPGLCTAGVLAVADKEYRRGSRLFGNAAARGPLPHTLPPDLRRAYEASVLEARSAFGEAAFAADWTEGQAMTLEQVVAYAFDD